MNAYIDIIFWLIIAAIVFLRLRSLLGTRPENAKVIVITKDKVSELIKIAKEEEKKEEQIIPLDGVDAVLAEIPDFNKAAFLRGAQRAFEVIIKAFAEGDTETLGALTSKKTFKKFCDIIDARKSEGQTAETDFIGMDKAEIIDAKLSKNTAKIVVNFISEQVNLLKNADGEIIQGDENFVQTIDDVWTFERDLNKHSNIWLLSSTKKQ